MQDEDLYFYATSITVACIGEQPLVSGQHRGAATSLGRRLGGPRLTEQAEDEGEDEEEEAEDEDYALGDPYEGGGEVDSAYYGDEGAQYDVYAD